MHAVGSSLVFKWILATEEGICIVVVFPFDKEEGTMAAFTLLKICLILFNPDVAHTHFPRNYPKAHFKR